MFFPEACILPGPSGSSTLSCFQFLSSQSIMSSHLLAVSSAFVKPQVRRFSVKSQGGLFREAHSYCDDNLSSGNLSRLFGASTPRIQTFNERKEGAGRRQGWLGRGDGNTAKPVATPVSAPVTEAQQVRADGLLVEQLVTLEANIDGMASEMLAYVMDQLTKAGAQEAWIINVLLTRGRSGHLVKVLCRKDQADLFLRLILRETTTLGVRVSGCEHVSLSAVVESTFTPWGWVPVNAAYMEGSLVTMHADYDSCVQLAQANNVPLKVVMEMAHKNFLEGDRKAPQR
eukprot:TRINITY_DN38717_c0_g1_i1.p1 TRINITY_DN38717_c0_g1~~TRINITY_DN38717_c0_g1_i1.p1  ORF type:complete len:286 (-),score=21.91 TRINITY_DN38717_c0_g1_i1:550-1407(-)